MTDAGTIRRRRHYPRAGTPTLRDVARASGASTASVSRALTRPELVSDALREPILSAARALGYVPNQAARTLSGRRSKLIGAVVNTLDDPLAAQAIDALTRRLAEDGIALVLAVAGDDPQASLQRLRELVARGVEAVALFGLAASPEPWRLRAVPCVSIDRASAATDAVGFDRGRALALGARYLRELRHGRVGLVALGQAGAGSAVRDALGVTDLTVVDHAAEVDARDGSALRDALQTLLALAEAPTAIVCGSDAAATAILHECQLQGIAVPGKLSVVGFGDTGLARQARPALTSIRVPAREVGIATADYLVAAIAGQTQAVRQVPVKLVARDSTGPAPA